MTTTSDQLSGQDQIEHIILQVEGNEILTLALWLMEVCNGWNNATTACREKIRSNMLYHRWHHGGKNSHPELCQDSGRQWWCQSWWAWRHCLWSWHSCWVWGHNAWGPSCGGIWCHHRSGKRHSISLGGTFCQTRQHWRATVRQQVFSLILTSLSMNIGGIVGCLLAWPPTEV